MVLACDFLTRHVSPPDNEQIKASVLSTADELTRDGSSLPGRRNRQGLILLADEWKLHARISQPGPKIRPQLGRRQLLAARSVAGCCGEAG